MLRPMGRTATQTHKGTDDRLNVCVFQFLLRGTVATRCEVVGLSDRLGYDWFRRAAGLEM
jgi:hypothetical protein